MWPKKSLKRAFPGLQRAPLKGLINQNKNNSKQQNSQNKKGINTKNQTRENQNKKTSTQKIKQTGTWGLGHKRGFEKAPYVPDWGARTAEWVGCLFVRLYVCGFVCL